MDESDRIGNDEPGALIGPRTLLFRRLLPGPIERVWEYLTDSAKRGLWLASGEMELRPGGRVELNFLHAELSPHRERIPDHHKQFENGARSVGRVTRCEAPRLLAFIWGEAAGDSEVIFELSPRADEVLLTLTHRRLADRAEVLDVAAGWHTHLGILVDRLAGVEPGPFWSTHTQMEAVYGELLAED